ncbi:SpoIIE family protein phosphatase [Streptomyces sp. XM4193]|uniref:PP2C family protein-serine/threonine phosphatase n=1 Tax=Streptomyces sp. XM4193 TaxID=2929782 RepID=UPI001FF86EC3|nr:PP2C family protein-serine/threonine phosphatase [Streptomyces sp. XM4193]MCK1797689.1 SpoIIE family protein phosphatase [Streptomyces sp. XM4193]
MPQPSAERPATPAEHGTLDTLISQARRLRGGMESVRRNANAATRDGVGTPEHRWQRALCEIAVHHLEDFGQHLGLLRDGLPPLRTQAPSAPQIAVAEPVPDGDPRALSCRAGSAEWNLRTDEVSWSPELYTIFGRDPAKGPVSLDELPAWLLPEDQPWLMEAVTNCLVDAKPVDGEFRIRRTDDQVRTVHMSAEPVLASDGGTVAMWGVLRDVSEIRRSERALLETQESYARDRHLAQTEHRVAVEFQAAVLPPWRETMRHPAATRQEGGALELAAHFLPSATSALIGGDWYDAMELPDGCSMLTVGDLTGHGVEATSGMAMLLGAVRGIALAGVEPGKLMGHLNQLLDSSAQPALGSALCCHYDPRSRRLTWAQAGHPAPLLFREGRGRMLDQPEGVLLGAMDGVRYGQRTEQLEPGDLLVLHTDGLAPRSVEFDSSTRSGAARLLELAPRFSEARTARECVRAVVEEFGDTEREDDACALVARVCE